VAPLVASCIARRRKQEVLTRREEEVLGQVMLGLSNKAIALKLTMALETVKTHVKSILRKLDRSTADGPPTGFATRRARSFKAPSE
jgi:DNA-binding NarL/FixJ family response regulator